MTFLHYNEASKVFDSLLCFVMWYGLAYTIDHDVSGMITMAATKDKMRPTQDI